MKKIAMLASLALICIALPLTLSAQADTASSIAHLEQTWAAAQKAGDAAKFYFGFFAERDEDATQISDDWHFVIILFVCEPSTR